MTTNNIQNIDIESMNFDDIASSIRSFALEIENQPVA